MGDHAILKILLIFPLAGILRWVGLLELLSGAAIRHNC